MNTLQGFSLNEPFDPPTTRQSPFDLIAVTAGCEVAKPVALAFATSYQLTDVWAALRFHRASGGQELFGWMLSRVFSRWQTGPERDMSDEAVGDLRELAHEWLEGKR